MLSYAQNYEDVMLDRAFKDIRDGFFIDVGAWHPEIDSVTRHFYEKGWSGINIEPARRYYSLLASRRPRDINLNLGVGNSAKKLVFYEVPGTGLSSFSAKVVDWAGSLGYIPRKHEVDIVTLESICNEHCSDKTINFLKIDAEGMEKEVIQGMNWSRYRPIIVVVEAIDPKTQEPAWDDWEPLLLASKYAFVWFDGINRFYVRNENVDLRRYFTVPPNRLDGFFVANGYAPFCERMGLKVCGFLRRLKNRLIGLR